MCGKMETELTHLTAGNFEHCLASDDALVDFFNDFLSLPSFPEVLLYNQETGLFEVVSEAAESISRKIRSVFLQSKSQLPTDDPTVLARSLLVDNHYTACCLDKEQGLQWIMKERFPLFIQSDCYFEYRLAKLLSLWKPNLCIQKRYGSLFESTSSFSKPFSPSKLTKENITPALTCSEADVPPKHESTRMSSLSGEEGCFASTRSVSCFPGEEGPCSIYCAASSSPNHLNSEKTQGQQSPQQVVTPTKPPDTITEDKCLNDSNAQRSESSGIPIENMAAELVKNVIREVLTQMDRINTPDRSSQPGDQMNNCAYTDDESCQSEDCLHSAAMYRNTQGDEMDRDVQEEDKRGEEEIMEIGDKKMAKNNTATDQGNDLDSWYHGACLHGSRQGWDEFKEFLWRTPGERLLNLWMDIERLRTTRHWEKKNRHLVLMRSRYLLSGGPSSLSMELLSRLGLATTPCWTEEKLHLIQPCLTEALLSYWAPRFWTSQCILEDHGESSQLGLCRAERHLRPPSGIDPYPRCITLPPLRPDTCLPRAAQTQSYFSSSPSPVFGSRRMERMLQALHVDSRAGLFFTQFCEGSGNQLWENAVNLWSDLQQYHHLFYQDGLDPYRVQRQAQILYSTYLCSSASRGVGADEETRREVYGRLTPAFEELFDEVEEQVLVLLLEPWTQLISRDAEFYHRVAVQEEMRRVDSEEYRELQSLYAESELRLRQVDRCKSTPPPSRPATPSDGQNDAWSNVSPRYHGYRLGSLLRHRHEIQHFRSFLQEHDASVHLSCWLDLDEYRRTPQKNKDVRLEKSSAITTKYLNRKYFFGPNSPASAEQQEHIMRLAGGPERLKHKRLSSSVVVEIQDIVRRHIEKTWLPLFLATAEFTERQKLQTADKRSYGRSRRRREAWKRLPISQQAEGQWMNSSKEILLFRQVLLNPITCHQFQRFVSLKGDFLENDVLFWLEVQRYKDLCHSHSDEATIQQKISTIISCFINSSVPPVLQIDIPPEQAQQILHKRKELGPYVFREAQMSVFSELLKLWPQFQTLRSSVKEEQLLPLLEEQRVKHRARLQRRRTKQQQDEMETQEEEVEGHDMEQEDKLTREQSTVIYSPTQQMSWSYSKYMAALKREEVLLKKQSQLEAVASFSTGSDRSSSGHSFMSAGSRRSQLRPCVLSPRKDKFQMSSKTV